MPKNKVKKVGMFLVPEKRASNNHVMAPFHHKLTTFLPPQNTTKIATPPAKATFPPSKHLSQKKKKTQLT
jgi:hypothetical protein